MSADKYPSIFSRQMEAIVYIYMYMGEVKLVAVFLARDVFHSLSLVVESKVSLNSCQVLVSLFLYCFILYAHIEILPVLVSQARKLSARFKLKYLNLRNALSFRSAVIHTTFLLYNFLAVRPE